MMLTIVILLSIPLLLTLAYACRLWRIANENAEEAERLQNILESIRAEIRGTSHEANVELILAESIE